MKFVIIIASVLFVFGASAVSAKSEILSINKRFAEVQNIKTRSMVYRVPDDENGVICYIAYHEPSFVPTMDCVKK